MFELSTFLYFHHLNLMRIRSQGGWTLRVGPCVQLQHIIFIVNEGNRWANNACTRIRLSGGLQCFGSAKCTLCVSSKAACCFFRRITHHMARKGKATQGYARRLHIQGPMHHRVTSLPGSKGCFTRTTRFWPIIRRKHFCLCCEVCAHVTQPNYNHLSAV
jgi:hypothetical protein